MKQIKLILFLILALLALSSCGGNGDTPGETTVPELPMISVSLEECDGLEIIGQNPIRIRSGEDAVFKINIKEGYALILQDGQTFGDDGSLTFSDVKYPSTLNVRCQSIQEQNIELLSNDSSLGSESLSVDDSDYLMIGSHVTVSAEPGEDAIFLGFSLDRSLMNGGTFLTPETTYSFEVTGDAKIYANYNLSLPEENSDPQVQRVIYHANGGKIFGYFDEFYADYHDDFYYYPNTLPDLGYFTREGYVLGGYNTKPDGSGEFVGCGWNALTDENNTAELYAEWLPVTDPSHFTFRENQDVSGYEICSYSGHEATVVIPEFYCGKPVTDIGEGAFRDCGFSTLMISRNIRGIADGAITGCADLETIIFSDGVLSVSDECISDCPAFRTLQMSAVMMPRYSDDRDGTYAVKYEHLRSSKDQEKLMIVAGSNCSYGIDSTILYDELGDRYDIINYGCNAYAPALFFLEASLPYFGEGDILLLAGEDNDFQFGRGETRPYIWHFFESAYEAFMFVDQSHFVNTFTSFAEFNNTRINMRPKTYQDKTKETVNRFGDYIKEKKEHTKSFDPFTIDKKHTLNIKNVTRYKDQFNASLDAFADIGVRVWTSYSVINRNYLDDQSLPGGEVYEQYVSAVRDNIHATVISDFSEYIMSPEYFYNSNQHLNTAGQKIRTNNLLEDILTQLAEENGEAIDETE